MIIEGYAAYAQNLDTKNDIVDGAALARVAALYPKGRPLLLLYGHEVNSPVGFVLELTYDGKGLWMKAELDDTFSKAAEIKRILEKNVQLGLSIGFKDTQSRVCSVTHARILQELDLIEISVCLIPANPKTIIAKWEPTCAALTPC